MTLNMNLTLSARHVGDHVQRTACAGSWHPEGWVTSLPREFTRTASPQQGPQGATPRTRSASATPVWTADLDSVAPHTVEDFSSCTTEPASRRGGPPQVTRMGLSEVGPQAQPSPALRGFCTPPQEQGAPNAQRNAEVCAYSKSKQRHPDAEGEPSAEPG